MEKSAYNYGRRVTIIGILANIVIAAAKLSLGLIGKSAVLIAEAFDSLSDVAATTAVLIGLKFASSPKDEKHPHGHGKIESVTAMFVGVAIAFTGVFLIYQNVLKIYNNDYTRPEWIALAGVGFAIAVKAGLYNYTLEAGKKLNSPSIRANALDHKSDVIRLSGVFIGIIFAIVGLPVLDPIAAIIVSFLILHTSFVILKDSFNDLIDAQMPEEIVDDIKKIVSDFNPEYHVLESIGRRMGGKYQVNMKIRIGPYVQAVNGVSSRQKLEEKITEKIPMIQGVDISFDVDTKDAQKFEERFKSRVMEVLEKYKSDYLSIENLEFHFLEDQQEVHCDMFVNPNMTVKEADMIRKNIKQDIIPEFEFSQVIITIQPATIH